MDSDWSLREDLLLAAHRLYQVLAFCLVGAFIGALVAYLAPTPYRASRELYVGLNVGQAGQDRSAANQAGTVFVNANDYKNWQMASLNSVVFMDPIIDETLARLQAVNPYWTIVGREELARMLHVYWRNAGKWRLVAESQFPDRAIEAVLVWQDVLVDHVHRAVAEANQALTVDTQIQSLAQTRVQAQEQLIALTNAQQAINDWRLAQVQEPAEQPLDPDERADLQQILEPLQNSPTSLNLAGFPASQASRAELLAWLEPLQARLEQSVSAAGEHSDSLEGEYQDLSAQFAQASQGSLGLSPELLVQKLSRTRVYLEPVRPWGVMMLVGAVVGWIVWALWWLYGANQRFRATHPAKQPVGGEASPS
jgi:hypothetical protein